MSKSSNEAIEKSGLNKEDIEILIPHQANVRIIEGLENKDILNLYFKYNADLYSNKLKL